MVGLLKYCLVWSKELDKKGGNCLEGDLEGL